MIPTGALAALAETERLLVALDFDGTLAPLVDDPLSSRALPDARDAVLALEALPETRVAIITGRDLATLSIIFPESDRLLRVGSHGAEYRLDGDESVPTSPTQRAIVAALAERFEAMIADTPGAFVEVKPGGLSVHTRRAGLAAETEIFSTIRNWVAANSRGLFERSGKNVLEYVLAENDKGTGIDRVRERVQPTATLYAGDDVTDEAAFLRLGSGDLSVHVGEGPTAAVANVADAEEFASVLGELVRMRADHLDG